MKKVSLFFIFCALTITTKAQEIRSVEIFLENKNDTIFLRSYLKSLINSGEQNEEAVSSFIENLSLAKTIYSEENFELMRQLSPYGSLGFNHLLNNKAEWQKVVDPKSFNFFFYTGYGQEAYKAGKTNDEKTLIRLCDEIIMKNLDEKEKMTLNCKLEYYPKTGDNPYDIIDEFINVFEGKYTSKDIEEWSYQRYVSATSKEQFEVALSWGQKSISLNPNYSNTDLVANIYFKLEDYSKAKKWALKSLILADKEKIDRPATRQLVEAIKKKQEVK